MGIARGWGLLCLRARSPQSPKLELNTIDILRKEERQRWQKDAFIVKDFDQIDSRIHLGLVLVLIQGGRVRFKDSSSGLR